MRTIQIALDGPSGSGKSTIAQRISAELGFYYIDTGALYRAVGLWIYRAGIDPEDEGAVSAALETCRVRFAFVDGVQHTYLGDEDVSAAIRQHEISQYASKTSAFPAVRQMLLDVQRKFAGNNNVIMDGRDIGTAILPEAPIKIFLTASPEDRAKRRCGELKSRGQAADFETVLRDQKERDHRDATREIAPLRQAEDAVLVDTTGLSPAEGYQKVRRVITARLEGLQCGEG